MSTRSPAWKGRDISLMDVAVIVVLAGILFMYLHNYYGAASEVAFVNSGVDGRRYLVRNLPDSASAADVLAALNARLTTLVAYVASSGESSIPYAEGQRLRDNFDPENVSEGGAEHGYTSYSVNKGEKIVMCIRQKDDSFVDLNVLTYVAIHELAHLMTADVGHTQSFWSNFRALLQEAVNIGVYEPQDFATSPQEYCGIQIASSVL